MKKIEHSITGNDVVSKNMIGGIFGDTLRRPMMLSEALQSQL
jgi:hypothetical protein